MVGTGDEGQILEGGIGLAFHAAGGATPIVCLHGARRVIDGLRAEPDGAVIVLQLVVAVAEILLLIGRVAEASAACSVGDHVGKLSEPVVGSGGIFEHAGDGLILLLPRLGTSSRR